MASRSIVLAVALSLTAFAAGCGKLPASAVARAQAMQAQALADRADEPCDEAVVAKIAAFKNLVAGTRLPAQMTAAGVEKPEMIEMRSPNRSERKSKIDTIVLHHTASPAVAKNIGSFFSQPSAKVSAHYVVDKTGYIVLCVNDEAASWHAGKSAFDGRTNVNDFSIGIEICNTGNADDPYPQAQYESLGRLMAYLMATHNVGWNRVTRHRDVATPAGRKNDTSDGFSRQTLIDSTVAAGGPTGTFAALTGNFR